MQKAQTKTKARKTPGNSPIEQLATESLEKECASIAEQIAAYGVNFQIPVLALLEIALVRLFEAMDICTQAEWRYLVAHVKRDMLKDALAQAPAMKEQIDAERRKQSLALPNQTRIAQDLIRSAH